MAGTGVAVEMKGGPGARGGGQKPANRDAVR